MQQLTMLQNAEYSAIDNLNKFEKFEVRWQKLKKKSVRTSIELNWKLHAHNNV